MKKIKYIIVPIILSLLLSSAIYADSPSDYEEVIEITEATIFSDVSTDSYYYDAVNWAVSEGITTGTSATTFSPTATCTRGQVATFLWRALGSPEPEMTDNAFADVSKDAYYYKAVLWAYENYITNGTTATTFSPDSTCTSGQIITFLWRALGEPKADVSLLPANEQSAYYAKSVAWAKENGLLNHSDTVFKADNLSPRADIVTYLYYVLA